MVKMRVRWHDSNNILLPALDRFKIRYCTYLCQDACGYLFVEIIIISVFDVRVQVEAHVYDHDLIVHADCGHVLPDLIVSAYSAYFYCHFKKTMGYGYLKLITMEQELPFFSRTGIFLSHQVPKADFQHF